MGWMNGQAEELVNGWMKLTMIIYIDKTVNSMCDKDIAKGL